MAKSRNRSSGPIPWADVATDADKVTDAADRLVKALNQVGQALDKDVAQGADKADKGFQSLTKTIAGGLVGGITAAAASFRTMFNALATGFGVANNQLVQLAAAANPAAAVQLDIAFKSLTFTLGQILQPIVQGASRFLRGLADVLYNLSPGTKALVIGLAAATVAAAALLPVIATLTTAFIALGTALGYGTAGISVVLAAVAVAFAGAATGAAYFASTSDKLMGALEPLKEMLGELIDVADELISAGMGMLADVLAAVVPVIKQLWAATQPLRNELGQLARAVGPLFSELLKLASAFTGLVDPVNDVIIPAIRGLTAVLTEMVRALTLATVTLSTLSRRAREGGLADFAGIVDEVNGRLEDLARQRAKQQAPFGPLAVRASSAEEFSRSMTRSALTASFAGPDKQREDPPKETAKNTADAADSLKGIKEVLDAALPGLTDYLRRVGGQR